MTELTGDAAPCSQLCYCARAGLLAENAKLRAVVHELRSMETIERLRAVLEDARHYAAVCPPPPELTGDVRIEMLQRRHRIGMAAAHKQRGTGNEY